MSVLVGKELKKAIQKGLIKIEPFDKSSVGPGSIDLTLGNDFRIFKKRSKIFHVKSGSNFEELTRLIAVKNGKFIIVRPGEMILGITKEKITLAQNIAGLLEGRSRFARLGLAVHVTASFMQPGIANHQVLEIVNLGHAPLAILPGIKICQMIFLKCAGRAKYEGKFTKQIKP